MGVDVPTLPSPGECVVQLDWNGKKMSRQEFFLHTVGGCDYCMSVIDPSEYGSVSWAESLIRPEEYEPICEVCTELNAEVDNIIYKLDEGK